MAGNGLEKVQVACMLKEYKKLGLLIQVPIFFATFATSNNLKTFILWQRRLRKEQR
jgi:hypothetical protein